jgi:O-glycosyl hydrolase
LESPAGLLVRNVSSVPVTGSLTIFFSEGNRVPIWLEADTENRKIEHRISEPEKYFFIIIIFNSTKVRIISS